MLFNPDLTKQAHGVIFSRKNIKIDHLFVYFNEASGCYLSTTFRYAFR